MKNLTKVVLLVIILLLILIIYHSRSSIETFSNQEQVEHIFWTGGYDSTFMICRALIDLGKIVQPYYIIEDVDNCKNCSFKRKNRKQELNAMKNITKKLSNRYPDKIHRLRPTIFVENIPQNDKITNLFYKQRLHNYGRRFNQYEAMCRFADSIKTKVSIGTVDIHGPKPVGFKDTYGNYLKKHLIQYGDTYHITDKNSPLYYLAFPIAKLSKEDIKNISIQQGYFDIIKDSWSCWFPKRDGSPCGRCNMCHERIISHKY